MIIAICVLSAVGGFFLGYAIRIENREDKKITEINESLKQINSKLR